MTILILITGSLNLQGQVIQTILCSEDKRPASNDIPIDK